MKKKGLGKGIDALIPEFEKNAAVMNNDDSISEGKAVLELKLSTIEPNKGQPRKDFDEDALKALADSIAEYGVIQPIVVQKIKENRYTIVAGERRWRASRIAGLKTIPAIIKDYNEQTVMEIALIENLQREDLNPIEEALGYRELMDKYSLTQEQISIRIGKSRPAIANSLRLLTLCDQVLEYVRTGRIFSGHARCLVTITDKEGQIAVANEIIKHDLSVRDTELLVKNLNKDRKERLPKKDKDIYIADIETRLSKRLGYKVTLSEGTRKNKIEIDYYNNEDLEKILNYLGLSI
ncbi:MAG: ParB/RepB/Spo0J family partition protein [Eubacteriales bacterium]|nr:ParB/RepB/Spo0J family partition protein [Eubacteriales bacterium]